jgi:3-dehydroquinate synthase II
MVTTALEGGADALVVPPGWDRRIKDLGRIRTVSHDGDLVPGRDVFFESLSSPEDEKRIAHLLRQGDVVLDDEATEAGGAESGAAVSHVRAWEVIPLENLVALGGRLFVAVHSEEDATLAMGILEKGVTGFVIHASDPAALSALLALVKASMEEIPLETAVIESIRPVGLGDRVCIDTCSLMSPGEGMLVGNSSSLLFLIQAEVKENPYVATRPFRVNAGPVHAYVRVPHGRTRYLSELGSGDPLLIVNSQGGSREATAGRIKVERRPLVLVHAVSGDARGSLLVQNAETIRLTGPDGEALSIAQLKQGDKVLVAVERSGRHFGIQVEETIQER